MFLYHFNSAFSISTEMYRKRRSEAGRIEQEELDIRCLQLLRALIHNEERKLPEDWEEDPAANRKFAIINTFPKNQNCSVLCCLCVCNCNSGVFRFWLHGGPKEFKGGVGPPPVNSFEFMVFLVVTEVYFC